MSEKISYSEAMRLRDTMDRLTIGRFLNKDEYEIFMEVVKDVAERMKRESEETDNE